MTDQNALADQVRAILDGPGSDPDKIQALHDMLPPRPTLADMTAEERAACLRMQCDTAPNRSVRGFIADVYPGGCRVIERDTWEWLSCSDDMVTPRPDLPRLEWPGTEKPAPAPALPDGWLLADHPDHGRIIVTNPTPTRDGRVYYVLPSAECMGFDWLFCDHSDLTYLDQEADTADAVPESTLAVGSVWHASDALARACKESGRDQIIALDRVGNAYVWDEMAEWWEGSAPPIFAPYTIIHTGKKADQ